MRPNNRRGKRQKESQDGEKEAEVDDLAVAATFAQVTTFSAPQEGIATLDTKENEEKVEELIKEASDDTESESKDDSSDDDDDDGDEADDSYDESADGTDDESEVDLTKALKRMKDDEEDGPALSRKGDSQVPRTENEVDPYRTPISDLEQKFQLNLTVAEKERRRLEKEGGIPATGPIQLCAVSVLLAFFPMYVSSPIL